MERLALIGVSHKRGGAQALEAWQTIFTHDYLKGSLGLQEFVLITTCNRWDVVVVLPDGCDVETLRTRLIPSGQQAQPYAKPYAYVADAALEQLTRITCALDSLNPGEDQIMNQVREVYTLAKQDKTLGSTTAFAFETALKIAKQVRREINIAPMHTSLFSLAKPEIERVLTGVQAPRALILGTGEMGTLAARTLSAIPHIHLTLANRTLHRAEALAAKLAKLTVDVQVMTTQEALACVPAADIIVACTPVANLITLSYAQRTAGLKLLIDMGMPRNVATPVTEQYPVLDIDSLQGAGYARRKELAQKLAKADQLIHDLLAQARSEWNERQLGPAIRTLREQYTHTLTELAGDALNEAQIKRIVNKLAQAPTKGLRALAREHGMATTQTYLKEAKF